MELPEKSLFKEVDHSQKEYERREIESSINRPCKVSSWVDWLPCTRTCEGGISKRYRNILESPNGQNTCPPVVQYKYCNNQSCDYDKCNYTKWKESDCSFPCQSNNKTGIKKLSREVSNDSSNLSYCDKTKKKKECKLDTCDDQICPISSDIPHHHIRYKCEQNCFSGNKKCHRNYTCLAESGASSDTYCYKQYLEYPSDLVSDPRKICSMTPKKYKSLEKKCYKTKDIFHNQETPVPFDQSYCNNSFIRYSKFKNMKNRICNNDEKL